MTLTPRQIAAYLSFNARIDKLDRAADLVIAGVGAQGDQAAFDKLLKELQWR